jgi:hypothetical protein
MLWGVMVDHESVGFGYLASLYGRPVREALDAAARDLQPDPEAELAG